MKAFIQWIGTIAIFAALLISSGCTSQLWDDADPNERLWIDATEITEAELKERGVHYIYLDVENEKGYLVEKDMVSKLKDYNLRMLGTPVTITVDAASGAIVGGAAIIVGVLRTNPEVIADLLNGAIN